MPTEKRPLLEDKLFTMASRLLVAISLFLLTTLWAKVDEIDSENRARDRDLARFMLEIEHRLTSLETTEK